MSFALSKIGWWLLQPGNVFFLLFALGTVLLWSRWRVAARRLLVALLVFGTVTATVPLGQWLVVPLENRFPPLRTLPKSVDGIVVLGGAVNQFITRARGQVAVGGSAERLIAFSQLAAIYPTAKLVFSGGSGDLLRQDIKEAEAAGKLLTALGIDRTRILFDDQSRNTIESAVRARRLAEPKPGERWLLVTSASHMPRAHGLFRAAGWTITAYPVDYTTDGRYATRPIFSFAGGLGALGGGLKEWIGLGYAYLAGRTQRFFPGPDDR